MSAKGEVDGTEKVCEAMHASVSETVSQTDEQTERKIFFFTRSGRERERERRARRRREGTG